MVNKLQSKIESEKKALEDFVSQANQEIAARNGRIAALKEAAAMLEEDARQAAEAEITVE